MTKNKFVGWCGTGRSGAQMRGSERERLAARRANALKAVCRVRLFCPERTCPLRGGIPWSVVEIADHLMLVHGWSSEERDDWVAGLRTCPICLGTGRYPWGRLIGPLNECENCRGIGETIEGSFRFQPQTIRDYASRHGRKPYKHQWLQVARADALDLPDGHPWCHRPST